MKKLVAYFSASGVTKSTAETLAKEIGADLFEIEPKEAYTKADLDWTNSSSRSTVEMKNKSFRPEMVKKTLDLSEYDTIFVGFPIWWYVAPTIINTFGENYNFSGKTIIPFATSGGSGMGKTTEELIPSFKGAKVVEGKVVNRMSPAELKAFAEKF